MNDHSFLEDPDKAEDGRWMQRPAMDWAAVRALGDGSPPSRIHAGVPRDPRRAQGHTRTRRRRAHGGDRPPARAASSRFTATPTQAG